MAALIEFVCIATHARRNDPSITLEQRSWAYCSWGALADHQWTHIDPTSIEALRSLAGKGRTRLVRGEDAETDCDAPDYIASRIKRPHILV